MAILSTSVLLEICAIAFVGWLVSQTVYNLYFHPLSKLPGPRLAAVSRWYEFYFDVFKRPGGQFPPQLQRLHRQYGKMPMTCPRSPYMRLTVPKVPLSVLVPTNCMSMMQASLTRFIPWDRGETSPLMRQICSPYQPPVRSPFSGLEPSKTLTYFSVVSTVEHDLHKVRRAALNPYFSVRSVTQLESIIKAKVSMMCDQIGKFKPQGKVLSIRLAFSAAVLDITTEYCTLNGRQGRHLPEKNAEYLV